MTFPIKLRTSILCYDGVSITLSRSGDLPLTDWHALLIQFIGTPCFGHSLCSCWQQSVPHFAVSFELTLCVANTDDDYWGGDQDIPQSRPSYQINSTKPGTDAAAGASAAFSACSALYSQRSFGGRYSSPASLANSSYAAILLTHAQQLYSFAVNASGGQKLYQSSAPAVAKSYKSNSYQDELTMATLFLAWATNSTSLYQQAEDYYSNFRLSGGDDVFNWDSKTPGLAVLFSQIIQSSAGIGGNLISWQKEAERYFDNIVNQTGRGKLTKS
jgi:endoglucanase